ncbi:MAG TPA: MGMT family protein [Candidatus Paceibacterota bacterium]
MTIFEQKVYNEVKKIPKGQVRTYKEIARAIGRPRAYRAVGNALNRNPDLTTIPCHRVVRSDGKIGGYRYGTHRKQKLLAEEGVFV